MYFFEVFEVIFVFCVLFVIVVTAFFRNSYFLITVCVVSSVSSCF